MKPDDPDEAIAQQARDHLKAFFDLGNGSTSIDIARARVAASVYSTQAKLKQSAGAGDALQFAIARELSRDRGDLQRFLTAAMPTAPIVRALNAPDVPDDGSGEPH